MNVLMCVPIVTEIEPVLRVPLEGPRAVGGQVPVRVIGQRLSRGCLASHFGTKVAEL